MEASSGLLPGDAWPAAEAEASEVRTREGGRERERRAREGPEAGGRASGARLGADMRRSGAKETGGMAGASGSKEWGDGCGCCILTACSFCTPWPVWDGGG